jgi:HK97 gp10 family phage protein
MIGIKVDGLKELEKALMELPKEIQGRPLRSAVSAAAGLIRDKAIEKAPLGKTGTLRKEIYRYRSRRNSAKGRETFFVGVKQGTGVYKDTEENRRKKRVGKKYKTQGKAYYWRFFEFGTIKMQKQPFLRPALENNKAGAVDIMKERLRKAIDNQVKKLAKK